MLAPALVDQLEHDLALELAHRLLRRAVGWGGHRLFFFLVELDCLAHEGLVQGVGADHVLQHLHALLGREIEAGLGEQAVEIPFLVEIRRAVRPDHRVEGRGDDVDGALAEVFAFHDLDTPGVDDLALLVHHFVVLEDVLADLSVARFDGVLRAFDRLGDHLRFDRLVLGHRAVHYPRHGTGREHAKELVLEREVEATFAGVALAARATA